MKSIVLSKTQKLQLIEMIVLLFPQYKTVDIIDGSCDYCLENKLKLSEQAHPKHNDWVLIHWFEFCWEILNKLMTNKTPLQITKEIQLFGMVCFNKQNVVEYLYEMFKEQ